MSRAYRPRLSKDKAVAQRVGAELERERLYGYSVSKQMAALGTTDSESPNSPKTASAVPAPAPAPAPAEPPPPPPPPPPPLPPEVAADAVDLRTRPSSASRRRSFTPAASSKGRLRLQRNSNRDTTAGKASNRAASAAAAAAATAVAGSPAPTTRRLGLVDSSLGRSPSLREASRNEARRSEASRDGWPCVSCSFLNVETAKKCLMCNTRHCQPRPSPPLPVTVAVAVAAPAEVLVDDADDVEARDSAVRACSSTDNQGRRGSGVRERRSSRGSPNSDDAPSSARRRKESNDFAPGDIGAFSNEDCVPNGGESSTLAVAIGGRSPNQGSVGRNGTDGTRASAGAGAGAEGKGASATGVAPAAAGAELREGKRRSQPAADAVATAAAPASAALAAAAATVTVRMHFSMPDNDDGDACRSFGLPSPSPSPPPPPLPLPPPLPQQTRGRKRSRAPPPIAAAEETEAAEAPSSPASRSAAVALLQRSTREEYLTIDLSGDASSSPAVDRRRRAGSSLDPTPGATTNGDGLEPPLPTTPTRQRAKAQKQHPPPFVVTPLTDDVDERKGRQDAEVAKGTTSVAASVAVAADDDAGSGAGTGSSAGLACLSPSRGASARGRSWPTAARVASLDFSGGGAWKVSSVTVTVGDRRLSDSKNGSESAGTAATASTAVVVVCHSGGVSVWYLTDAEAVCRYVSPALTGESRESARGRFFVAAVVGGGGDVTEMAPSTAKTPERMGICIVAIGRHEADPGLPIIRVWQGSPQREGRFGKGGTAREKTAPPEVLTATVKKKITSYFPPVVPRNVAPCLCLCGYSTTEKRGAGGGGGGGGGGGEGEVEVEVEVGEVTAVMALGGKVVRLMCAPGRSGSDYVKAKSLPTGSVGSGAVCTSLAPVPSNPFLVWASFPSSNAVLLWDVRELQLLLTLPLTSSSICVPAVAWPWPLSAGSRNDDASIAEGGDAGSASAAGSDLSDPSSSLSSSAQLRRSRGARRDPRLLCLLATGSRSGGGGGVSGGGSEGGSGRGGSTPTRTGCGLFGVCRAGSDGGEGALGCSSSISAVRLEAVARDENSPPAVCSGDIYSERRRSSEDEPSSMACLSCLSEGNGFMAGVDRQGRVVARDLLTGEPHVLFTAEIANNTRGGGGAVVSSMDCDRFTGVFAVATGDVGGGGTNFVDIYTLSNAGGELATGVVGDVRVTA